MRNYLFAFLFMFLSANMFAATKIWDGGGADTNWGTAANWSTDVAPVAGDDLGRDLLGCPVDGDGVRHVVGDQHEFDHLVVGEFNVQHGGQDGQGSFLVRLLSLWQERWEAGRAVRGGLGRRGGQAGKDSSHDTAGTDIHTAPPPVVSAGGT